ncbi:transcriptional regulator [Longimycelium tulufanense]|uniref:Transcriptional regulator n=1 Tax=Longimycelium tulufanense TaxID=907463 RepID=A0A8J3CCN7_9PSEU|nr:helix-turn-helix transcriptional regulator [Longimycelium tulufanense]GGM40071.1 transcriptional regulator [Longimycelium tulufanense]
MAAPKRPTVRTRGLAYELRVLRNQRNLTCRKAAEELGWQASKLSRMETGQQKIDVADVASLLVLYKVRGQERARLLELAKRAEERGWWETASPGLSNLSRTMIGFEADAVRITTFQLSLVPGLLQTADYTRALMRGGHVPAGEVEPRVVIRMGRQAILSRESPPEYLAIIDEAALRRRLGGTRLMARQLRHIVETAERPNVAVQVLPLSAEGHPGLDGPFTILNYTRGRSVVHLEHKISSLFLDKPEEVSVFSAAADTLRRTAMDPEQSVKFIEAVAWELERE